MSEFDRSTAEYLGQRPTKPAHSRGRGRFGWVGVAAATLLGIACVQTVEAPNEPYNEGFITPKSVETPSKEEDTSSSKPIIDSGKFPQCEDIKYQDPRTLYQHPLSFVSDLPRHPQLRHAINTLYANGLYDLQGIDLLPQAAKLEFDMTALTFNCLPDNVRGVRRELVQVDNNIARTLPSPGQQWPIEITLPEGLNPIKIKRLGQAYANSPKRLEEWVFLNLQRDEVFTLRTPSRTFEMHARGPVSFPLTWEDLGGGNPLVMAKPIIPLSGFAEDKPLPLLEDKYPGTIINGKSKVGVENHSGLSILASCAEGHLNDPLGNVFGTLKSHLDLSIGLNKAEIERVGKWHAGLGSVWRKIVDLQTGQEAYLGVSSSPTNDRAEYHGSVINTRGDLLRLQPRRSYEVIAFAAPYDESGVPKTQIPLSTAGFSLDCAFID